MPLGSGSGFVWDDQGHIVTNFHVVRNANVAQVAILTTADSGTLPPTTMKRNNKKPPTLMQSSSGYRQSSNKQQVGSTSAMMTTTTPKINPFTSMRTTTPLSNAKRKVYLARVVGVDPTKDIAVLKVDAPREELFPIAVGTSTGLKVGQQSLAIGNPFGLDHTLTAGVRIICDSR